MEGPLVHQSPAWHDDEYKQTPPVCVSGSSQSDIGFAGARDGLDDAAASATKPTDERFELPTVEKLVGAVHAAITSGDVVRDPLVRLQAAGAISLTPASPLSFDSTSWATPPPASKLRPSSSEVCSSDPSASY